MLRHGASTPASWALAGTAYPHAFPSHPGVTLPVGALGAISEAGNGSLVLVGYPQSSLGLDVYVWPPGDTQPPTVASTPQPAIPAGMAGDAGASGAYLPTDGITFRGASGWMLFDDTAVSSGSQGSFQEIVWRTLDYGKTWSVVNPGPVTAFPGISS